VSEKSPVAVGACAPMAWGGRQRAMETAQRWARILTLRAEITMFQISEVQESPAFNGRRSILTLRRHIVQNYFIMMGKPIDEKKLFQYTISDACWENIENFVSALKRLPMWINKDLSKSVFGGRQNNDFWQSIFESGCTPIGVDIMPKGINVMEMIQPHREPASA
jgi:hypothetical protein